jgi:CDP-diacylglycerol--glycerol-3-phosphate 3-phosphatidyltransferase
MTKTLVLPATRPALRHVPNALSASRIVAAPIMVVLAFTGQQAYFTWLLVPALLTDMADGIVARVFRLESKRGALLDSVGDLLLLIASCVGIWAFHREVMHEHVAAVSVGLGAWALEAIVSLVRYGRLSSFHTYVSKVAGYLLGIFIGVLFLFGFQPWLFYLAIAVSVIGNLEELVMLALLPRWRPDVRGLVPVLRERRKREVATA